MAGISSEELSAAAGIVLSLGFSYIPGVSQRFDGLTPTQKRLAMLGLLLACALGVFGLSCANSGVITAPACDRAGAWGLALAALSGLAACGAHDVRSAAAQAASIYVVRPPSFVMVTSSRQRRSASCPQLENLGCALCSWRVLSGVSKGLRPERLPGRPRGKLPE